MGLVFKRHSKAAPLQAFFDAAFADTSDYKSTAGWVAYAHGALIAYDSSTIKRVVSSSTEAECNAMATISPVALLVWLGRASTIHRQSPLRE